MAQTHYKGLFKKALLQFVTEPDPLLSMLKWVMTEMMRSIRSSGSTPCTRRSGWSR